MSSQLTHERCSELLAGYLEGELEPEQHRLVQDHLAHCAQCAAERAGLDDLRSSDESEGLTTDERVVLRAAVLAGTAENSAARTLEDESDAVVVPLGGRGARASKYLGIAALLAILAVGSLFVFRGGHLGVTSSDDSGSAAGGGDGAAEDSGGGAGGEDEALGDSPSGEEALRFNARNIRPNVQPDRGAISEGDLDRLGQSSFLAFKSNQAAPGAQSEDGDSAPKELLSDRRAPENTLGRLAARAPMSLAPDVTECGRTALDQLGKPGLATYATTASLEGEDVVVIGFVTGARSPDRYAVFAFPRGDCTTILASTEGPLE